MKPKELIIARSGIHGTIKLKDIKIHTRKSWTGFSSVLFDYVPLPHCVWSPVAILGIGRRLAKYDDWLLSLFLGQAERRWFCLRFDLRDLNFRFRFLALNRRLIVRFDWNKPQPMLETLIACPIAQEWKVVRWGMGTRTKTNFTFNHFQNRENGANREARQRISELELPSFGVAATPGCVLSPPKCNNLPNFCFTPCFLTSFLFT